MVYTFKVNLKELSLLRQISVGHEFATAFQTAEVVSSETLYRVRLTMDMAEELRTCLTDRLAVVGFEENYELTSEGQLLEDLIDRFYVSEGK